MDRRLKTAALVSLAGFASALASPSSAGLLDGISNPLNGLQQHPANTASPQDLEGSLTTINVRFALSMQEMLLAQSFTLAALGDKARADQLSSEANSLQGVNDINTVSRSITVSEDASKEINDKMNSSQTLDAQSKGTLAMAVPHYGSGMLHATHLPGDYQAWIGNAKATVNGMGNNPLNNLGSGARLARDLPDVVEVTSHLPDLLSTWSDTTNNFMKYAHGNKVDTGDLASKI